MEQSKIARELRAQLLEAIDRHDLCVLERCLEAGADPGWIRDCWNDAGAPPILRAMIADNEQALVMLLAAGASIEAVDFSGRTLLRDAIELEKFGAAIILLSSGANPWDDATHPSMLFILKKVEILKFAHHMGVDIDRKTEDGRTLLHHVCKYNLKDAAVYLIKAGLSLFDDDREGITPMDIAKEHRPQLCAELQSIMALDAINQASGPKESLKPL